MLPWHGRQKKKTIKSTRRQSIANYSFGHTRNSRHALVKIGTVLLVFWIYPTYPTYPFNLAKNAAELRHSFEKGDSQNIPDLVKARVTKWTVTWVPWEDFSQQWNIKTKVKSDTLSPRNEDGDGRLNNMSCQEQSHSKKIDKLSTGLERRLCIHFAEVIIVFVIWNVDFSHTGNVIGIYHFSWVVN